MINKMIDVLVTALLITLCSITIFSPAITGMRIVLMFIVTWYAVGQTVSTSHKLTVRQYIVRTLMLCGPISVLFLLVRFMLVRGSNGN